MTIVSETRVIIEAALSGDPALTSLTVVGLTPKALSIDIAPGVPPQSIGGCSYSPHPPFYRETVSDLLVQTQRSRWQPTMPFPPMTMPPEERDLLALHSRYEKAIASFECGSGWTDLLDAVFLQLHNTCTEREWFPSQIKEKYGSLRIYWHGDLPEVGDQIICAAEHLSAHICEICGAPGSLRRDNGWWSTRCKEHR
jgi:hypothetical protein